jgi:hypothetical protein
MSEEPVERRSDAEAKIAVGKQKKDVGDQAFKAGQLMDGQPRRRFLLHNADKVLATALRSYHEVGSTHRLLL